MAELPWVALKYFLPSIELANRLDDLWGSIRALKKKKQKSHKLWKLI